MKSDGTPTRNVSYTYFFEAVLIALLVLGPALAIALAFDLSSGSVAEWVAGLATVAAVVAAVFAARYAKHVRDIEMKRDQERDLALRRNQAEQVAVWAPKGIDWEGPYISQTFRASGRIETTESGVIEPTSAPVTLLSNSPLPIFGLEVEIYIDGVLAATHRHLPPLVGRLEEVEVITFVTRPELVAHIAKVHGRTLLPPPMEFGWSFKDLVGRSWRWVPREGLKEIPPRASQADA